MIMKYGNKANRLFFLASAAGLAITPSLSHAAEDTNVS
jgi:hypothetical protein